MYYIEEKKPAKHADSTVTQQLLLDGTVHLDYTDDEIPTPGLLAWIRRQLGIDAS